ncbi:MAG TPA: hypothetical protein VJT73_20655 [Polyangiaceae bacterium]|nr:hypothetical protein [Polyangiaceae bacterium]
MSIDLAFWRVSFHTTPVWHLASMGFSAFIFVLLVPLRGKEWAWLGSVAFLANNVMIAIALWVGATALTPHAPRGASFQAQKLGALAVALLAPPLLAGLGSIGIFVGSAVARDLTLAANTRARFAEEPWATLAYGAFAVGLYLYRLHAQRLERRMHEALAEARALQRVSRVLLAIRDFSNSPLQTLQLTTALLRLRHGGATDVVDRMDRALARLCHLNQAMARYESEVDWQSGEESMDAIAVLERERWPS